MMRWITAEKYGLGLGGWDFGYVTYAGDEPSGMLTFRPLGFDGPDVRPTCWVYARELHSATCWEWEATPIGGDPKVASMVWTRDRLDVDVVVETIGRSVR